MTAREKRTTNVLKQSDNAIRPPKLQHVKNAAQVVARYLDSQTFQPCAIPNPLELTAFEVLLQHATTKRDA